MNFPLLYSSLWPHRSTTTVGPPSGFNSTTYVPPRQKLNLFLSLPGGGPFCAIQAGTVAALADSGKYYFCGASAASGGFLNGMAIADAHAKGEPHLIGKYLRAEWEGLVRTRIEQRPNLPLVHQMFESFSDNHEWLVNLPLIDPIVFAGMPPLLQAGIFAAQTLYVHSVNQLHATYHGCLDWWIGRCWDGKNTLLKHNPVQVYYETKEARNNGTDFSGINRSWRDFTLVGSMTAMHMDNCAPGDCIHPVITSNNPTLSHLPIALEWLAASVALLGLMPGVKPSQPMQIAGIPPDQLVLRDGGYSLNGPIPSKGIIDLMHEKDAVFTNINTQALETRLSADNPNDLHDWRHRAFNKVTTRGYAQMTRQYPACINLNPPSLAGQPHTKGDVSINFSEAVIGYYIDAGYAHGQEIVQRGLIEEAYAVAKGTCKRTREAHIYPVALPSQLADAVPTVSIALLPGPHVITAMQPVATLAESPVPV